MNSIMIFVVSVVLGGLSWGVCSLVSDRYEPFDTGIGFAAGQAIMAAFTGYIGFNENVKKLLVAVFGMYLGMNSYAYAFGGGEARAWAYLLLLTSLTLCVIPMIVGLSARAIRAVKEYRKGGDDQ